MSVLDRAALEASPLADLHAIASELSIDGYRRLRRADLIDAILAKQGGEEVPPPADDGESAPAAEGDEETSTGRRRRGRRGGRGRSVTRDENGAAAEDTESDEDSEPAEAKPAEAKPAEAKAPARRRGAKARQAAEDDDASAVQPEAGADDSEAAGGEEVVEGVVELLANGSGFVRVDPPDPSDDDVYISSAQVKRCELVSGDRVAGPKRAPRRSERFASLIRIETINGRPASELADSVRFEDLPAAFPDDRIKLGSEDPTLKAIEWLTPFGKGSRVTIVGAARSGKTEALRRLAQALTAQEELSLSVVLAGVRPEEIAEWSAAEGPVAPVAAVSFAASEDARNGAIEPAIDQARRLAARGADAVVLIDTLDGASLPVARKALAAARNIVGGGSLTVIATAAAPIGGETTVIALDAQLTGLGRFPALDLVRSGTIRAERLVGEAGAEAIARSRAEAAGAADA